MKKIFFIIPMLLATFCTMACPVCERQQPRLLKGITHGAGPDSNWDYVIVSITVAIVALSLFYSVKWLIRPKEKSTQHIKRFILNHE